MDVGKYRALFIEEMREHLAELSRLLVELEGSAGRDDIVDEVFRAAHSIKGMAGSMGYDPITSIAHRMEDVVSVSRSHGGSFPRDVIDLLLRAVDALSGQVEDIAEGRPLEGRYDLVRDLGEAVSSAKQKDPKETPPEAPTPLCAARGVRVRLARSCSAPSVRAFLVHRKLSEVGEIVSSAPSIDDIKSGQFVGNEIHFVFSMTVDEAEVQRLLAHIPDVEGATFEDPAPTIARREPPAVVDKPDAFPPAADSAASEQGDTAQAADATAAAELSGQGEAPRRQGRQRRQESVLGAGTVRVRTDILDTLIDTVGELYIHRERLRSLLSDRSRPEMRAVLDGLDARIRRIHDQVLAVRMIPLRTLTDRFPRLVRDLCHNLGKTVELDVQGDEIELDRAVLDHLDVPFIHTLRNAVDHGIESPAERVERGKPSSATLRVVATRDRDSVAVTIEDDGRGMDTKALQQVALKRGLITPDQLEKLSLRDSLYLICMPGFSSKQEVTDISGRGVGMDVVRSHIEGIGGSLDIESTFGLGTRITLRLPLTLSIVPALLVAAGDRVFALPVAKVVAVREGSSHRYEKADGARYVSFDDRLVPIRRLTDLLGLQANADDENTLMIGDRRFVHALGVERIVGYHEVVVKPLGEPLDWLEWFSGATILGDGQPVLILDLPRALRSKAAA